MKRAICIAAVLFGLVLGTVPANAAPMFYANNEATFLSDVAAAGGTLPLSLESFEEFSSNTPAPFTTVNGVGVTDPGGNFDLTLLDDFFSFATDGNDLLYSSTSGEPDALVEFTFSSPIQFFAIDVIDLGSTGTIDLTLTTDTGTSVVLDDFSGSDWNVQFVGVIDPSGFSTVTISNTRDGDAVFFDRLQFGTAAAPAPVPEPVSLAIWGIVGLAAGGAGWRRRRAAGTNPSSMRDR